MSPRKKVSIMNIVYRIGKWGKEMQFDTDTFSPEISKCIIESDSVYRFELDDEIFIVSKGRVTNSFQITQDEKTIATIFCGFGNERKNEETYIQMTGAFGFTVRKDINRNKPKLSYRKVSSPYFLIIHEQKGSISLEIITKISQFVYVAVLKGLVSFDWNGTKSL